MQRLTTTAQRGLLAFFLMFSLVAHGQGLPWQWASYMAWGGPARVVADSAGNTYVLASLNGANALGNLTFTSQFPNAVVAKYSPAGTCLWAVRAEAADPSFGYDLALDRRGNLFLTGGFGNSVTLGGTTLLNPVRGTAASYLARLSAATGIWQWAQVVGGGGGVVVYQLEPDEAGGAYVAGSGFTDSVRLGNLTYTIGRVASLLFVGRCDAVGTWQWLEGAHSDAAIFNPLSMRVNPVGEVYVAGWFRDSARFGPHLLLDRTSPRHVAQFTDGFVAKLTPARGWHWAVSVGGANNDFCQALAPDDNGGLYVAGSSDSDTLHFDTRQFVAINDYQGFVGRLDASGTWQWIQSLRAPRQLPHADARINALLPDGPNLLLTGRFQGRVGFGTDTLTSLPAATPAAEGDGFVAKLSGAGVWQWSTSFGGAAADAGIDLAISAGGTRYVLGDFHSPTLLLGPHSLTLPAATPQPPGIFLAAFGPHGVGLPEEDRRSRLRLSPNPAHHTVRLTGATSPTADLLDATGRLVRTAYLDPQIATLDLQGLAPGLYLVRAGNLAQRLVVE